MTKAKRKVSKRAAPKKLRVAVAMGGWSDERPVSMASGKNVLAHLDRTRYQPRPVVIDKAGQWRRKLTPQSTDLVFIALHGTGGEDGHLQGYLDLIGLPYTGSGLAASAIGMDKVLSKVLFESAGIPVPSGTVLSPGERLPKISPPVVVKPVSSGSSIGVTFVETAADIAETVERTLNRFGRVLIEPLVRGRELTVPVIGNDRPRPLPVIEITPRGRTFFDYQAKYKPGGALEETPANLADVITQQAQHIAVECHRVAGCRGYSRTDMLLTPANHLKVLEINTLPGLTPASLLPKSAAAAGLTYGELLDEIIRLALEPNTNGAPALR